MPFSHNKSYGMGMINGKTRLYGIIGKNIAHTLSPAMHNMAFKHMGINAVYLPFEVTTSLKHALKGLMALSICGTSVTFPFKQEVMPYLEWMDDHARTIGAVNTLVINKTALWGYNTDWLGIRDAIKACYELKGKRALVLGAGGAARAAIYGLKKGGAEVFVVNRTKEKAKDLAHEMGIDFIGLEDIWELKAHILVQCTTVGQHPRMDESPIPLDRPLPASELVFETNYGPGPTALLKSAINQGLTSLDGKHMLLWQGVEQFRIWTGLEPPVKVMKNALGIKI